MSNTENGVTWKALGLARNWLGYQKGYKDVGALAMTPISANARTVARLHVMIAQIEKNLQILALGERKSADRDVKLAFVSLIRQYTARLEDAKEAKNEIVAFLEQERANMHLEGV